MAAAKKTRLALLTQLGRALGADDATSEGVQTAKRALPAHLYYSGPFEARRVRRRYHSTFPRGSIARPGVGAPRRRGPPAVHSLDSARQGEEAGAGRRGTGIDAA